MSVAQIRQYLPTLDVWLVNISALGFTLANVEHGLAIISLLLAIGYSVWRWARDYQRGKAK